MPRGLSVSMGLYGIPEWCVCVCERERERQREEGREGDSLERENHMSRLRALNVFAEFRVWKSQIRECHVFEIAQTSHDASIAEIKCAIWWSIFWAFYQTLSRGRKGRSRKRIPSTVCTKYVLRVMLLRQGSGAGDQVTLNYAVIIII